MTAKTQWTKIAEETTGSEYGHVPGNQYHDVKTTIGKRGDKFRVEVIEVWGSCQGYDEEHGRKRVVAIDTDLDAAVRTAKAQADEAGIRAEYAVQSISCAAAEAVDALADAD